MNTLTSTASSRELLSALADGELSPQELTDALQVCAHDSSAMGHWAAYQAIGDVLRSQAEVGAMADTTFLSQFKQRLTEDIAITSAGATFAVDMNSATPAPLVLPFKKPALAVAGTISSEKTTAGAANDAIFRWKLVAGFASLAAVSAIAWNAAGLLTPVDASQLAQASPSVQQVLVASPQGNMVRDARLEELLAAHKQMGGTSALQVPAGFLRNATFDMPRNAGR